MSAPDTMMPLLAAPWPGRFGEQLPTFPLPGLRREAIANIESHWTGTMTPEMRQLLQFSCGLSQTPIGSVDFTGRWYPEEPLSVFRPTLTLAIDDQGRRWIAEVGKRRGLPGRICRNRWRGCFCATRHNGFQRWIGGLVIEPSHLITGDTAPVARRDPRLSEHPWSESIPMEGTMAALPG